MDITQSNNILFDQPPRLPLEVSETLFEPTATSLAYPVWSPVRVVLGSFLGFWMIFLTYCLICHMSKLSRRSKGFIMNMCQILVSETQAIIASVAGVKIVLQTWSDVVFAKSALTNWYAMVFVGYLLYDMIAMFATEVRIGKTFAQICRSQGSIYCHHAFFCLIVPPVALFLRDGKADNIIGCFLTMEIPVIFLHFQHVLSMFGKSGTRPYLINGLITLVTYFIFRILIFPFMFYRLAVRKGVAFLQIYKHVSKSCAFGSVALMLMQVYWFALMLQKACRVKRGQVKDRQTGKKSA